MEIALRNPLRILLTTAVAAFAWGAGYLSTSEAGIGESRDQLVGEGGPYGNPSGETSATLKSSKEKVDVFKRGKVTVSAEYDSDSKVWKISFQRKSMTDQNITALLGNIGGAERKWSKPVTFRGNKHWISSDKKLHAVYYSTPLYKLVIMTDEAARTERLPQSLTGRETKRVAEDDIDAGSKDDGDTQKKDDPLKDFWGE